MFNDKSGQLLLIGAFMLAMVVVTISLMLNNVIYASNLAYVGFMDQTRFDNIGFRHVTADEMNYAYDQYHGTAAYNDYMRDYKDAVNRILNIEGKYVEFDTAAPGVPDPHTNFHSNGDQHILSIYSKNSKASYAISTGAYTPAASTYTISISSDSASILSDGSSTVMLTVHVTKNGADAQNEQIAFESNRIRDYSFIPVSGSTFTTDASGTLKVYYSDGLGGPGFAYISAYPAADPSVRATVQISCTQPVGAPSPFKIYLSPQTPTLPPYPVIINNGVDFVQITATVKDTVTGQPVSGVFVRFQKNIGIIDDHHGVSAWETGLNGQPQTGIFFYGDEINTGTADIYAYIDETNPDTISENHIYLNCQPVIVITDPTVDMAHSGIVPAAHGSDYIITVAFNFDPQLNGVDDNIAPIDVALVQDVTLDNPSPHFETNGALKQIVITTKNIPASRQYKIVLKLTFIGIGPGGVPYSKSGTLTVVGTNSVLYWDAANNPNYLTFP